MRAYSLVYLLLLVCAANCCSLIPNIPSYTVTERTILAPLVVYGRVLNTTATNSDYFKYKACIKVLEVIKGDKKLPKEICFGDFGSDVLCLTHVHSYVDYIFYMTSDKKANYKDGQPKEAAVQANTQTISEAKRGVCDPFLSQSSSCRRPIISRDHNKFKSIVRVQEGKTAEMVCHATSSSPFVVIWSKRGGWGHTVPYSSNTLSLPRVSMSDMGVYECTIWNPAGKTTAIVRLFIDPVPCGTFMYLKPGEQKNIQSPHYPQSYRKDKMCSWRICPSPGKRIKLDFKEFNLRLYYIDNLQILQECTPVRSTIKYCGSANPGVLVSQCASRCIQVWFQSAKYRSIGSISSNQHIRFDAVATATDEATSLFSFETLYCENDLLIKFVPKDIKFDGMTGRVVHSFKNPRAGSANITIKFESSSYKKDLFGCELSKVLLNQEYYIGAKRSSNDFTMNFAIPTNAQNLPKKFDKELNKFKAAPPNCTPPPPPTRNDG